jgi:hypothetical protein
MATIKIDGSAISNHWMLLTDKKGIIYNRIDIAPLFPEPNWYFNGGLDFHTSLHPVAHFNLPDGDYTINPLNDNSTVAFSVVNGLVDYDSSLTFLTGKGTDTLVLHGVTVTIDARYLIAKGLIFFGVLGYGAGDPAGNGDQQVIYTTCTLLPAKNYYFVVGSGLFGNFYFNVEINGTITMDSTYSSFMSIKTGNVLEIVGFPILIDGRLNGAEKLDLFGVYGLYDATFPDNHTPWSNTKTIMGNFVPTWEAHGYIALRAVGGASGVSSVGFRVSPDGTIVVSDANYLAVDTFNGIRRITVLKTLPDILKNEVALT